MRNDRERLLDVIEATERIERVSARGREYFDNDEMTALLKPPSGG